MDTDSFKAASEAAESWLNTVGLITYHGQRGKVGPALDLLKWLHEDYHKHAGTLRELQGDFASVSDGPVKCWSSAHEAAEGIAQLALDSLLSDAEGLESWGLSLDEIATLQERIRRERAKIGGE